MHVYRSIDACTKGANDEEATAVSVLVGAVALAGVAVAQRRPAAVSRPRSSSVCTRTFRTAATYGVSSSNAVKMRFDDVNEKGGIAGRKIKLIIEDTQYQIRAPSRPGPS